MRSETAADLVFCRGRSEARELQGQRVVVADLCGGHEDSMRGDYDRLYSARLFLVVARPAVPEKTTRSDMTNCRGDSKQNDWRQFKVCR